MDFDIPSSKLTVVGYDPSVKSATITEVADQIDAFEELLQEMRRKHDSKGSDYSNERGGLSNLLGVEKDLDIPAWKGIMVRMSDKWQRLCTFARKGFYEVKDESLEDTLLDLATYSLLCIIVRRIGKESNGGE